MQPNWQYWAAVNSVQQGTPKYFSLHSDSLFWQGFLLEFSAKKLVCCAKPVWQKRDEQMLPKYAKKEIKQKLKIPVQRKLDGATESR